MSRERMTPREWLLRQILSVRAGGRMVAWATLSGLIARPMGHHLSGRTRLRQGLVIVLPGIEGEGFLNHDIAYGLDDGGVPDSIEIFDWTRGRRRLFHNLMGLSRNRQQAALLADHIRQYQRQYPDRPVHLVAHSGGAGIATMAMERLDSARPAAAAILLGAALSPEYNLAKALQRTRYGIYNLYSRYDFVYLGIGTRTFGTIDRRLRLAAGKVGFRVPESLDAASKELYRTKLQQVAWRKQWLHARHAGGHTGWADRRFCREWLSRIILNHHEGRVIDLQQPDWQ
jgi:pimeloyl-ACP methyl ester carboxylesterase